MKSIIRIIVLITFSGVIFSCSSDSEDDIVPIPNAKVTYDKDIAPAISGNCFACHIDPPVNNAPFALTNYNQVSSRASQILTAISKQSGATAAMPPSGRLPQTTIDLVDQWIKDGLLEN